MEIPSSSFSGFNGRYPHTETTSFNVPLYESSGNGTKNQVVSVHDQEILCQPANPEVSSALSGPFYDITKIAAGRIPTAPTEQPVELNGIFNEQSTTSVV